MKEASNNNNIKIIIYDRGIIIYDPANTRAIAVGLSSPKDPKHLLYKFITSLGDPCHVRHVTCGL